MLSIVRYCGPIVVDFSALTGKGARIGIIDSGVCTSRFKYSGARIFEDHRSHEASPEEVQDTIGHGTACAGIIRKMAPGAEIVVAKVFHDTLSAPISSLVSAIEWLTEQKVDVINLSLGTVQHPSRLKALERACDLAAAKNIALVSANCNEPKKLAYPAGFESVFGVDAGKLKGDAEFYFRGNGNRIELVAKGDRQILHWISPESVYMGGTSFASPRIAALVACTRELFNGIPVDDIRELLKKNSNDEEPELVFDTAVSQIAKGNIQVEQHQPQLGVLSARRDFIRGFKRAIVYPFNKEMHSLIRYRHLLSYEISGVVDFIGKRTIGKDPAEILGLPACGLKVSARLEEELENGDTLILGYVDELERITKKSIFEKCIRAAIDRGKRIYSLVPVNPEAYPALFKSLENEEPGFCSPVVDQRVFRELTDSFSPEEHSEKPIVAVFGTGPQQGKFTTQLALKECLQSKGYKVGHLSTEHQGELLGADVVFPSGYSSHTNLGLPLDLHIPFLRSAIRFIEARGVDLTVCGAQSGVIPFGYGEFHNSYTLSSIAFLMGVLPDAVILCVNSIDPADFVRQCIATIEAIGKTKVVALVFSDRAKIVRSMFGGETVATAPMGRIPIL